MQCPFCDSGDIRVLDSRHNGGAIVRVRACRSCNRRFNTAERIDSGGVFVLKRDGRTEPFSRAKLIDGVRKAASGGKNLGSAQIESLADLIAERVRYEEGPAVSSDIIGHLVLSYLSDGTAEMDVARIRYALVFLGKITRHGGFQTAGDALAWLRNVYNDLSDASVDLSRPSILIKRSGVRETFTPSKLERSIGIAAKGRGSDTEVRSFANLVAGIVMRGLAGEPIVSSQQVAASVLDILRTKDEIAYLRYASITKPYRTKHDFLLEMSALNKD